MLWIIRCYGNWSSGSGGRKRQVFCATGSSPITSEFGDASLEAALTCAGDLPFCSVLPTYPRRFAAFPATSTMITRRSGDAGPSIAGAADRLNWIVAAQRSASSISSGVLFRRLPPGFFTQNHGLRGGRLTRRHQRPGDKPVNAAWMRPAKAGWSESCLADRMPLCAAPCRWSRS